MGVASQRIDLLQPEQIGPGLGLISPARRRSNLRCTAGLTTPMTEKLPSSRRAVLWSSRIHRSSGNVFDTRMKKNENA